MSYKDTIISYLPELYKQDVFINDLLTAIGSELDNLSDDLTEIKNQDNFDLLSISLNLIEKRLKLSYKPNLTIEERISRVKVKYLIYLKCSLDLLKNIANCWRNGEVEITSPLPYLTLGQVGNMTIGELNNTSLSRFKVNSSPYLPRLKFTFNGKNGVPNDLDSLKQAISEANPAHIPIDYKFKYLLIGDIHNKMTIGEVQTQLMGALAYNE